MRIIRDDISGFVTPRSALPRGRRRAAITIELLTSFALICAIAIAAFAVGMEIVEAGAVKSVHAFAHGVRVPALQLLCLGTSGLSACAVTCCTGHAVLHPAPKQAAALPRCRLSMPGPGVDSLPGLHCL